MKLKSFSLISLLIIFSSLTLNLNSEEKIDIWNNEKKANNEFTPTSTQNIGNNKNLKSSQTIKGLDKIEIQEKSEIKSDEKKV